MDSEKLPSTVQPRRRPASPPVDWIKLGFVLAAIAAALALGASARPPPGRVVIVEGLADAAFLIALLRCKNLALPRFACIAAGLLVLLPAIELIPLPQAIWQIAPISELRPSDLDFLRPFDWRPFSLDADRTLHSLFALQACAAIFLAVTLLDHSERAIVARAIILVAIGSAVLGVFQVGFATPDLYLLPDAVPGTLTGLFGNRNHEGDFLVIAAGLATAFVGAGRRHLENAIAALVALVLAAAALATESRSAILLLAFVAIALVIVRIRVRARSWLVPAVLGAMAVVAAISTINPVVSSAFARFEGAGGRLDRLTIWSQTRIALEQTLPWGSGMGTFQPVYESIEPLDLVSTTFVNHAHNDLLQLAVENGLPGLAVLLAVLAIIGLRARAVLADRRQVLGQTALICLCVPLLHSLVDYPLRTLAIGSVAAVLAALQFAPVPREAADAGRFMRGIGGKRLAAAAAVLAMLIVSFSINLATALFAAGNPLLMAAVAPFSADLRLALAAELVRQPGRIEEAVHQASIAIKRNAFSSQAFAVVGTARLLQDRQADADAAFLAAAHLGWRDPLIQQYVFDRGIETGSAESVARAADAILRLEKPGDLALMDRMQALLNEKAFRAALVRRLMDRPAWQDRFFARLHPATPAAAKAQLDLFADLAASPIPRPGIDRLAAAYLRDSSGSDLGNLIAAWRAIHGSEQSPDQALVDPAFARVDGSLAPFGWRLDGRSAQAIQLSTRERPGTLAVQTLSAKRQLMASQLLALPNGRYALSYTLAGRAADKGLYRFQMRCLRGGMIPSRSDAGHAAAGGATAVAASFAIRDCAVQQLQLWFLATSGQRDPVHVSNVSIRAE